MTLGRLIYKNLLRIAKRYNDAKLPLTGLVGVQTYRFAADPASSIRAAFKTSPTSNLDAGLQAVKQLKAQSEVLYNTGHGEQVAYAVWHQALLEGSQSWACPSTSAAGLAWGSFAVAQMLTRPNPAEDIEESALLGVHQACQAASLAKTAVDKSQVPGWPAFQDSIDSLAQEVRNAAPAKLYPPHQLMSVQQPAAELQQQQLQHITQALFHKRRFRQEPYEWVYQGLAPLNVLSVLDTNKGISLTLATLYVCIARQLGIPMSMMPVVEAPVAQVEVPETIRKRQAMQTIAGAPEPVNWVVRTEWPAQVQHNRMQQAALHATQAPLPESGALQQLEQQQCCFADPRRGTVMSYAECQQAFPHLQMDTPWLPDRSVIQAWAEYAHVAVTAHQRRGESDAVAFWMYQLMALDTMAEEWQQVMNWS